MPPFDADAVDITTDLNSQSEDAVPFNGTDIPVNRSGDAPVVLPKPADGEGEKPASLRDMLSDAFKGTEKPPVDPAAAAADPAAAAVPGQAPELVKVGDRWHRRDGTYASKEDIAAFEARGSAPEGQAPAVAPPPWVSQLTPVEQQQFASLPAETRAFVERTMEGVNQRAAVFNEYGTIEQVIGPRRQAWADSGMPPAVAIQQILSLSDFAGRDPGQFVLWFSDQHKLDLDALLDARDAAGEQSPMDPRLQGLQQEIAHIRNAIDGMSSQTTNQQYAASLALVQAFADEKDDTGNPAHPYFADVIADVQRHAALIRQQQPFLGERDVLKAAYDFATYSNTDIRGRIQADQQEAMKNAAANEAAKARAAGVSINGGPAGDAGQASKNANRTLREELQHAYTQSTLQ